MIPYLTPLLTTIQQYNGTLMLTFKVFLILLATYIFRKLFDKVLKRRFRKVSRKMDINKTSYTIASKLTGVGIYIIGIGMAVYTIPGLRRVSIALMASAGFLGIVIGFAAQAALSNIISGIFIAMFQPFRVGDNLTTREHYGSVEDITLRHTVIRTPDNDRVIIPNSKIVDDYIINHSIHSSKSRMKLEIGIAYKEDIDHAKKIMWEEAENHELTLEGESKIIVSDLADSSVRLRLFIWGKDRADAWTAVQELREKIKKRFTEEGINIPFPQRTISYLNPPEDGE